MTLRSTAAICVLLVFVAYLAQEYCRVDLLLVGNITIDLVDGTKPTGGAVSYAAVAAKAYGLRACVVTGHQRKLQVTANPNITITRHHVPRHCQRARVVILGPLTLHDVDAQSFLTYDGWWDRVVRSYQPIGLMAQGFQRQLVQGGKVQPLQLPSTQLLDGLSKRVSVFLSDVETVTWPTDWVQRVAQRSDRLLITEGAEGAEELNATGTHHIDTIPVDEVVDTNGAGDTFATAYMIALAKGWPNPGHEASWAASRAVMQPQLCKPDCACDRILGAAQPWSVRDKLMSSAVSLRCQCHTALMAASSVVRDSISSIGHGLVDKLGSWVSVPMRLLQGAGYTQSLDKTS